MLGKIWRHKYISATAILALASMAACTRNIPQASNSGKDARYKGAKKIELENGEGRTKGIVTYPGGDRVDWKYFEIPEEKKGSIKINLRHKPPRPGLDVAFDVYDQYFARVARAKPSSRGKRSKSLTVKNMEPGKYYIQVYAPRRIDAGSYRLKLRFKERKEVAEVDIAALADQIPEPPTLPAVPEPIVVDPEEAKRLEEEAAAKKAEEDAAAAAAAADAPKPVTARIVNVQAASGGSVIITLNKGKENGVERGWAGNILRGGRDGESLEGGDFKVIKVTSRESVGKVKLSVDQVKANKYARLSP